MPIINSFSVSVANVATGEQYIIDTTPPGESLNEAFVKVNDNFDQIFAAGPVLSNIQIANNTVLTLNTNGNLILSPNGVGSVIANAHVIPDTANVRDLGSSSSRWRDLYLQYANISGNIDIGGTWNITGDLSVAGNLSVTGDIVGIANIAANVAQINTIQLNSNSEPNIPNVLLSINVANNTIFQANVDVDGSLFVMGQIDADTYIGDGSQLTGVVTWTTVPVSNTSPGSAGQAAYDVGGNLYVCVSSNTWSKFTGTTSW